MSRLLQIIVRWGRSQRLTGVAIQMSAVVLAVTFAWVISRPPAGTYQGETQAAFPRDRGPLGSQICGPFAVPRPPPPIDSPFGVHLFATTPLGVIHPLRAMSMADHLMPPASAGKQANRDALPDRAIAKAPSAAVNETALDDVESVSLLLQEFRRAFGAMPVGELNEEIVRRLQGENPRGLAVLPKTHPAINAEGELLDRWGTPYRFHPESSWMMTVRSAGPDKRMWTSDDILATQEGQPEFDFSVAGGFE